MKKFLAVMIAFMIATCGTVGAASELVSINGVTLSVKEAGHGEPMILLHGKGYSKEYMDSLFNYYAERYHVFSYDSRGHGKSDKPEAFTLEDDADDLAGLIGHYGLSKPIIIGFSMGSYIILTAAEKYPDLFSKIILISTRGRGDTYPPERISEAKDKNEAAIIKALINFDLMSNIGNVKIPALVITGENDATNPPAEGKKVADALSASKFEVIPNAPHVAFMNETERKIVFDVIDEFLAGTHERRDYMRLITVEEHFTAQEIINENNKFSDTSEFYKSMVFVGGALLDAEEGRLSFMDNHKITMQVLSYTSPVSENVPASEAVRICKRANDILAEKVKDYPERFAAFATLPMVDPEAAAAELERCVKEFNFCGALLAGQFKGHFYEEERFFPIFEKAAELDVPVSFHPAPIDPAVQDYYYTSPEYSPFVAGQFASAGFGWHVDAGIHEVRLILSGIFDKLPNLKIIAGHWGEAIPSYLERLDYMLPPQTTGLRKKVSDYYKENFYITPSGILSPMQFEYMVKLMGADHILWAVDYPYIREGDFYGFLKNAEFLTQEQKELIAHKNAERILHIKGEF